MVMDRGYNSARALIVCADRGVAGVRYNPWSLSLYDATTAKIDWWAARQKTAQTEQCWPVRVQVQGQLIEDYLHGGRLPPRRRSKPDGGAGTNPPAKVRDGVLDPDRWPAGLHVMQERLRRRPQGNRAMW